ncbi:unnamed protein product [Allacma fusca]|uniref:Uncharacterized protein n=1 Tax=Allacma fusca TaxID=39272 RepID=A0A8J2KR98_9HEXA|nr:unnamed protein product [Allacma fusca]
MPEDTTDNHTMIPGTGTCLLYEHNAVLHPLTKAHTHKVYYSCSTLAKVNYRGLIAVMPQIQQGLTFDVTRKVKILLMWTVSLSMTLNYAGAHWLTQDNG